MIAHQVREMGEEVLTRHYVKDEVRLRDYRGKEYWAAATSAVHHLPAAKVLDDLAFASDNRHPLLLRLQTARRLLPIASDIVGFNFDVPRMNALIDAYEEQARASELTASH